MALVVDPWTFANGTIADADLVNDRYDVLYTLVNGQLDNANLDLGVGAGQFYAVHLPILDAGGYYPTDNVEAALQDLASGTVPIPLPVHTHQTNPEGGTLDHGLALTGLLDDDHKQYILVDGTRAFTGNQSMGSQKITSLGNGTVSTDAVNLSQLDSIFTSFDYSTDGTGTLPVANGGTGVTCSTGTGCVVLNIEPELQDPSFADPANTTHSFKQEMVYSTHSGSGGSTTYDVWTRSLSTSETLSGHIEYAILSNAGSNVGIAIDTFLIGFAARNISGTVTVAYDVINTTTLTSTNVSIDLVVSGTSIVLNATSGSTPWDYDTRALVRYTSSAT